MDKKKILQINSCNIGSTGNIMLDLSTVIKKNNCISYVAYPKSRTNKKKMKKNDILIGNIIERNIHLKLSYYTGYNGCFSRYGTKILLKKIDSIKPDIIHLHNLHNCYINLDMLFKYIKKNNISVVWTLHDCWAFTGHCPHFTVNKCDKWKYGCYNCSQYKNYPKSFVDKTKKMYELKKQWFTSVNNLTIVTPSYWLSDQVKESFLSDYKVEVINNGIDLDVFKPTKSNFRKKYNLENKIILLGVASSWSNKKGLNLFFELSQIINNNYKIVLVGLSENQIKTVPKNILAFSKTDSKVDLAKIYTTADFFINPSLEETMGLVTLESLACGTPVIVSNSTAVPEVINKNSGVVVENYTAENFYSVIKKNQGKFFAKDCIERAKIYKLDKKYNEYIELYKTIMKENE